MDQYPKWLLAMTFPCLIPALLSIFFLFGGLHPFGQSGNVVVNFLLYLATNLLWVVPTLLFFLSLWLWGKCQERWSVMVAVAGLVLTATDVWLIVR